MAITHRNRRGQEYYLHVRTTRTGKETHYFSRKATGDLAARVPDGFEVYEHPDGRVYLRRELPRLIHDDEVAIVEDELKRVAMISAFRVDRRSDTLIVYVSDGGGRLADAIGELLPFAAPHHLNAVLSEVAHYEPVMQFVLVDTDRRQFQARRYCYRGSVDDWIDIGSPGSLADVAREYLQHVNTDYYYDLL